MVIRKTDPRYKRLRRPCATCENYFCPSGSYTKHCDKCLEEKRIKITIDIAKRYKEKGGKTKK